QVTVTSGRGAASGKRERKPGWPAATGQDRQCSLAVQRQSGLKYSKKATSTSLRCAQGSRPSMILKVLHSLQSEQSRRLLHP
ncbi:hypothetical protein STEG23_031064, partial [Scotinomys teguina]